MWRVFAVEFVALLGACHTSLLTPHTSHLTPHTSHLTPHTALNPQLFYCHASEVIALNMIKSPIRVSIVEGVDAAVSSKLSYSSAHYLCRQSYDWQRKTFAPFSESKKGGRGSKGREDDPMPFSFDNQHVMDYLSEGNGEVRVASHYEKLLQLGGQGVVGGVSGDLRTGSISRS